jgi:hypothetical protein
MLTYTRKEMCAKAKEARVLAKAAMARSRKTDPGMFPVHRTIEVNPCSKDGREEGGVFLEMKEITGKGLSEAIDMILDDWDVENFTGIYVSGGVDLYENLKALTDDWGYDPWVEEWELLLVGED